MEVLKIVKDSFHLLPERLPERLKQILVDLEINFGVIKCIETGIEIDRKKLELYKTQIYENYSKKEQEYLQKYIFLVRYTFIQYLALFNSFNHFFRAEITNKMDSHNSNKDPQTQEKTESLVSTATQKDSIGDNYRGKSEDSLHSISPMGTRGAEDGDVASIENIPLDEVKDFVEQPIIDLGIFIDKETMKHFQSLVINLDPRDEDYLVMLNVYGPIFKKIEDHFKPQYGRYKWAWPIPYLDKEKKKRASFKIRMTSTGYFEITLNRKDIKNVGIKRIVKDILTVFNFLSREERKDFILLMELIKRKQKAFVHLANKLFDEDNGATIEKTLKGAILKVSYIDMYGEDIVRIKVDYSEGPEIEFEGEETTCLNLNKVIVEPAKAQKTLRGIADNIEEIMDLLFQHIIKGTNDNLNFAVRNRKLLLQQKKEIKKLRKSILKEHDMLNRRLINIDVQNSLEYHKLSSNILNLNKSMKGHGDTLALVQESVYNLENQIPGISEEINFYYNETNKSLLKISHPLTVLSQNTAVLSENVAQLPPILNTINEEIHNKIDHRHSQTEQLIIDQTNYMIDQIEQKIDTMEQSIKDVIKIEFHKSNDQLKQNLEKLFSLINILPGISSKEVLQELQKELKVSERTIYNYLTRLESQNLIESIQIRTEGPGRRCKRYSISNKAKNLLKKLKKQINWNEKK